MIGVVLAAGNGTRMQRNNQEKQCKVLQEVNHTRLIEYALNNLVDLGVDKVCVVIGKHGATVQKALGFDYRGMKIIYAWQNQQKGLIHALVQALPVIGLQENVVLQLADEIFIHLKREAIKELFLTMKHDFYCGITYENQPYRIMQNYSVELSDDNQSVIRCIEKPCKVVNNIKGTGFCIIKNTMLQLLKEAYNEATNTPNNLCDFINELISMDKKVTAVCVAEKEFNINTPTDLQEAETYFLGQSVL